MKITKIKTYVVPAHVSDSEWAFGKAFVLVKVETDESLYGWGEAYVPNDCELAIAALVDASAIGILPERPVALARVALFVQDLGQGIARRGMPRIWRMVNSCRS